MKVFLSHEMTGLSDEEVLKIREEATEYLKSKYGDIEIIDNFNHTDVPENAGRVWHLGTSIRQMEEADAIYFVEGHWKRARGCIIERQICHLYNLKVIM